MRYFPLLPSGLILATAASIAAAQNATAKITCDAGLHLIVARGSGEPVGTGYMGTVARNVSAVIANSTVAPLEYPATLTNYFASEGAGVKALSGAIEEYATSCPDGRMALLGYSQGAQVAGDTLCGTSGGLFNETMPLATSFASNIIALVLFGDPTHVANLSWTAGTSKRNGIFPRENTSACDPFADKMRSWCDTGDIYCDSGNITLIHRSYFGNYTQDAVDFIVSKFNATESSGSGNATATPTGTPSATQTSTGAGTPSGTGTANAAGRVSAGCLGYIVLGIITMGFLG